ncbi:MAG: phosphopantothenoylcysteine decarboxylase, partial [Candidatus Thermoplasmatota archaeon]|nr:phosphopantothenoylcysteine decarboxylase [Candidatus Thermoplasmatota archaeon]
EKMNIDSVVCAAAISDFVVSDHKSGKIESGNDITLTLTPFEKILDQIPQWIKSSRGDNSGYVIGFKLLTNSNRDQLLNAARYQIDRVGVSAVVANDLSQLTDDGTRALWVTSDNFEELKDTKHIGVAIDALLRA